MDESPFAAPSSPPPAPAAPSLPPAAPTLPSAGPRATPSEQPEAVSYTELMGGTATSPADVLRARQRRRRYGNNLLGLVAIAVFAVIGVIVAQAYLAADANRQEDDDYTALCRSDRRSIAVSLTAFQGDQGRSPTSLDELRIWGLPDDALDNWTLVPSASSSDGVVLEPTPTGRCA